MRLIALGAAIAIGIGGYVHYEIWDHVYRHTPVREMFIANFVVSAIVVVGLIAVAASPQGLRRWVGVVGLLLSIGSLIAFALSHGPGLPTLHGTFKETGLETTPSYFFSLGSAKTVLVAEGIAAVLTGALVFGPGNRTKTTNTTSTTTG